MACLTTGEAIPLTICALILSVQTNLWHYPSCVVVNPNSGPCLSIFLRYFNGYPSAIVAGELVHHEWVQYLDFIYDYNDQSDADCKIRRQSKFIVDFVNVTWTRDGFSTCTQSNVDRFNSWWSLVCKGHCVEDDNCRRYPTYLGQHFWNNCSWDEEIDRPAYDLRLP